MVVTAGAGTAPEDLAAPIDSSTLDQISASQEALDKLGDALAEQLADLHKLQDSFESAVKKQTKSLKSVTASRRAQQVYRANVSSTPSNADLEFTNTLDDLSRRLRNRQLMMPSKGGWFVEMFLGSINVRFAKKSERLSFKSEYELIKLKFAPFGVVFCIVCLLLPDYRWCHMIFQLSVSCYYVLLAIRENILRVNGSNIRSWWIIHHYFTMMQSVLLLTWPNGASYARLTNRLHVFGLFNGILMIFQTRYQMARLYALRSLGMAGEMDVASSDNTQIHWSETMTLLIPLVFFGQILQAYMGIFLYKLYLQYPNELQIILLSALFVANFVGNLFTTIQTVHDKRATNAKERAQSAPSSQTSSSTSSLPKPQLPPNHLKHL